MRAFWTIPGPQRRSFVAKNPYIAFSLRLNNSYWSLCYKLAIQPSRLDNKFAKSWLPWPLNCVLMVVRGLIIERVTAWREICMLAEAVLWRFQKLSSSVYTPWCPHKNRRPEKKTQKQRLQCLFILNLQIILCNQSPACLRYCTFISKFDSFKTDCMPRAKFHISFIISWFIYHDYKSCFSFNSLLLKLVVITDDTNAEKA